MSDVCRRGSLAVLIGLSLSCGGECVPDVIERAKQPGRNYLSRQEFERNWFSFTEAEKETPSPWSLVDLPEESTTGPVLVCRGKPDGYLRTTEILEEYSLQLEWRFPEDPHGNSGILLHVSDEDKVWPESIQVQLHTPSVGSVFPSSGAETRTILNPPPNLKIDPKAWNQCRILSHEGVLRISVNDIWVGDVKGCQPDRGHVALQSEGSEVHFRNLEIRPLTDEERRTLSESNPERSRKKSRKPKRRG